MVVDADRARARHAGLAHAAGHHRCVAGHTAARGDNAFCRMHAVDVLRRGLDAHKDGLAARLLQRLRLIGREHDLAARRAGRSRQTRRDRVSLGVGVDRRMQQLIERAGLDARYRLLAGDKPLVGHIDGEPKAGAAGALAVAGLQHPELAALDGELHVLHVFVVLLQQFRRGDELVEHLRHDGFQRWAVRTRRLARGFGDVLRRANAGHDVLALRVDEELAIELLSPGRGIAGEGDACGAVLPQIAEHHRLNVDGSAPVGGNAVEPAVSVRAGVHPGAENGADRAPKLLPGGLRERLAGRLQNFRLVVDDDFAPVAGRKVGVQRVARAGPCAPR